MSEDPDQDLDPTERLRLLIIAVGLLANVAILYWEWRQVDPSGAERFEAQLRSTWNNLKAPFRQADTFRKAKGRMLWQAIRTVEGEPNGDT